MMGQLSAFTGETLSSTDVGDEGACLAAAVLNVFDLLCEDTVCTYVSCLLVSTLTDVTVLVRDWDLLCEESGRYNAGSDGL